MHNILKAINYILKHCTIEDVEVFSNIAVNLIVTWGGILGILYLKKIREKQIDATFNYLSKLKVRIQYLYNTLSEYDNYILDRFVQPTARRNPIVRSTFINLVIEQLSKQSKETLNFFMETDNQIPASEDWIEHCDKLIEFLKDCEYLSEENYYKWLPCEDLQIKQRSYYEKHIKNMEDMLEDIHNSQKSIMKKLYKREIWKKMLRK